VLALRLARFGSVSVVTKKENHESSTNYAQGGIASVFALEDSFELHVRDTLECGAGLCHADAVESMVREGRRGSAISRSGASISAGKGGRSRSAWKAATRAAESSTQET